MVQVYRNRRFFVPCASVTTYEGIITTIAASLDLPKVYVLSQDVILSFLSGGRVPTMLVLDNFETPWEQTGTRGKMEELLCHLCGLPTLTLVVTMRGAERPLGPSWSSPHPPLRTLDLQAARQTFVAISGIDEQDPHIDALLSAVDRLPLAITLMANMAQVESTVTLLRRWETEKTSMLTRGGSDRLDSLDMSIAISLSFPRMTEVALSQTLLSLLSLLPCGEIDEAIFSAFPCSQELPKAISRLLSTALAFRNANTSRLRVLAPIREYMLHHHPPEKDAPLLHNLARYYSEQAANKEVDFYSARNWVNLVDYMVARDMISDKQRAEAWAYSTFLSPFSSTLQLALTFSHYRSFQECLASKSSLPTLSSQDNRRKKIKKLTLKQHITYRARHGVRFGVYWYSHWPCVLFAMCKIIRGKDLYST